MAAATAWVLAWIAVYRSQFPLLSPAERLRMALEWSVAAGAGANLLALVVAALATPVRSRRARRWL
ncbi:MAG: hypothetical protein ACQGVC_24485, partial [Myxococcota bacterium]